MRAIVTDIHINGRFLSQRVTGVQRYARETLRALDGLLQKSPADTPQWSLLVPNDAAAPKLSCIEVRKVGKLRGHAWEQFELPWAARKGLLWSFASTGPLAKRRQVVTMHDAAVFRVPEGFGRAFSAAYRVAMPVLAHTTPLTMTVSEFSRQELRDTIGLDGMRCVVSGEGHEHALRPGSDARILERHGLQRGRYVLAVSSLTPYKNFGVMAQALKHLGEVDFQVVVAGATNAGVFGDVDRDKLSQLTLTGYVTDEELRALYENAALFVFPSRYEGFGLPPLEAMALGCPVIAARAAAMPEVCSEGAAYFSPDDPVELAALIKRLMADPAALDALRTAGTAQLERHRWESAARAHLGAAMRVLGRA
jgi:hypothetical protein